MTIQEKIQTQMADAMRNKDPLRLSVLRMMKSAIKNKEIEKMKPLDEGEALSVLNTLVKQRKDSDDDIRKAIEEAVQETGASSIKDMGKVMKAALSRLAGKSADGSRVSQMV